MQVRSLQGAKLPFSEWCKGDNQPVSVSFCLEGLQLVSNLWVFQHVGVRKIQIAYEKRQVCHQNTQTCFKCE